MAIGKRRRRPKQTAMWVATQDLPRTAAHPFYARLNQILDNADFYGYVESLCQRFYADEVGRPGLPPGRYFRLLLIGYFEGLDAERAIAWRAADSFALREFLGLETGAVVAVTVQGADEGDSPTSIETLIEAAEQIETVAPDGEGLEEVMADKGYHSNQVLVDLEAVGVRSYISEPDRGRRNWQDNPDARDAVCRNRRRIRGARVKRLLRQRGERLERPFAHLYETGRMRRVHLRGHTNILKRVLLHTGALNLGLLMRTLCGVGTPRGLQGRVAALLGALCSLLAHPEAISTTILTRSRPSTSPIDLHLVSRRPPNQIRPRERFHHGQLDSNQETLRFRTGRIFERGHHVRPDNRRSRRDLRARSGDRHRRRHHRRGARDERRSSGISRIAGLSGPVAHRQVRRGSMTDDEVEAVVERAVQESRARS
jgi:hypothetical protein